MDLFHNILPVQLLAPQLINNTDTKSSLLDTRAFGRKQILVNIGDCAGLDSDSTLELFLQESDTTADADFTDVAVADLLRDTTGLSSTSTAGLFATLNAASEDQAIFRAEYVGIKRYIRVRLDFTTGTGGITSAPVSATGLLAEARHAGASAPAPVTAT